MPDLSPAIELVLRAGAADLRRAEAIEMLAAALDKVAGLEMSPTMEKLRRICAGLVAAAPAERRGWQQMLHEVLIELDDAAQPDPALVAGWKRAAGERE